MKRLALANASGACVDSIKLYGQEAKHVVDMIYSVVPGLLWDPCLAFRDEIGRLIGVSYRVRGSLFSTILAEQFAAQLVPWLIRHFYLLDVGSLQIPMPFLGQDIQDTRVNC